MSTATADLHSRETDRIPVAMPPCLGQCGARWRTRDRGDVLDPLALQTVAPSHEERGATRPTSLPPGDEHRKPRASAREK
jgi:hypothetical protein